MSDDDRASHPFAGPLAAMEAEIAAAEQRGDPVMPQAYAMVARLRELMSALDGLNASLGPDASAALAAELPRDTDERAPD